MPSSKPGRKRRPSRSSSSSQRKNDPHQPKQRSQQVLIVSNTDLSHVKTKRETPSHLPPMERMNLLMKQRKVFDRQLTRKSSWNPSIPTVRPNKIDGTSVKILRQYEVFFRKRYDEYQKKRLQNHFFPHRIRQLILENPLPSGENPCKNNLKCGICKGNQQGRVYKH